CETSVSAERWTDAIRACRVLHSRDPDRDGLSDQLAAAYVGRGQQRLEAGDLDAAEDDFKQALGYQPESADAQRASQPLYLYRQGESAIAKAEWEDAIAQLSVVHGEAPDYLQGLGDRSVEGKLFAAWLGWGQSALAADDTASAALRCGQALTLVA